MKCDGYVVDHWYEGEYMSVLLKEYEGYEKSGMTPDEAFEALAKNHTEATRDFLRKTISV